MLRRLLKSSASATGGDASSGQARLEAIEEEETVRMHLAALKRIEVALQVGFVHRIDNPVPLFLLPCVHDAPPVKGRARVLHRHFCNIFHPAQLLLLPAWLVVRYAFAAPPVSRPMQSRCPTSLCDVTQGSYSYARLLFSTYEFTFPCNRHGHAAAGLEYAATPSLLNPPPFVRPVLS